jgi:undecaprenyl-diphosphatase
MTEETMPPQRQPDSRTTLTFVAGIRARALLILGTLLSWLVFALLSVWFLVGEHRVDQILLFGMASPLSEDSGAIGHFDGAAWSFTALGSPEIVAFFSAGLLGLLLLLEKLRAAAFVLVSVGGGTVLGYLTKTVFGFFRPHHIAGSEAMLNTSFPSGHALLAALFFLSGAVLLCKEIRAPRLRLYVCALAVLGTALPGASRVYLGLHWPSDVVAGWAFAAGWIAIANFAVLEVFDRGDGNLA